VSHDKVNLKILFEQKRYLKVIFIGIAVSFFTQTVGINAFNYYAPTIFQKTGFAFITNPAVLGWLFFICAIVFMIFHGISIGPACFLIPAEIFPLRIRGLGMDNILFLYSRNNGNDFRPPVLKAFPINLCIVRRKQPSLV